MQIITTLKYHTFIRIAQSRTLTTANVGKNGAQQKLYLRGKQNGTASLEDSLMASTKLNVILLYG